MDNNEVTRQNVVKISKWKNELNEYTIKIRRLVENMEDANTANEYFHTTCDSILKDLVSSYKSLYDAYDRIVQLDTYNHCMNKSINDAKIWLECNTDVIVTTSTDENGSIKFNYIKNGKKYYVVCQYDKETSIVTGVSTYWTVLDE